jgi:hypothetical protein
MSPLSPGLIRCYLFSFVWVKNKVYLLKPNHLLCETEQLIRDALQPLLLASSTKVFQKCAYTIVKPKTGVTNCRVYVLN